MKLALIHFHESSQVQLRTSLDRYRSAGDPEDLHNLRLGIKKLRVFYGFLAPVDNRLLEDAVGFLEESDVVFRISGRRRDVFLQQQYLGKLELSLGKPYPEYHDFLGQTSLRREFALQEKLAQDRLIDTLPSEKLINKTLNEISGRALERLFRREAELLYDAFLYRCDLWASEADPEHLHKARRELKALMYLLNIVGKSKAKINGRFRMSRGLKNTEQVIGKWHDHSEALHRLMLFMKKHPPRGKRRKDYGTLEDTMAALTASALQEAMAVAAIITLRKA